MNKIIALLLILTIVPMAVAAGDKYWIHASDGSSYINGTDICVDVYGTMSCLSDATAGAGINTIVAGSGLFGGGSGSTVTLNVSADTCGAGDISKYNGTGFECVADATGAGGVGKKGDGTYTYNDSTTMYFNSTYAGVNLEVNGSNYWDDYDTANTTWFQNIAGALSLKLSEFSSYFDTLFSAKDTDDLTEGSSNLYDNQSWTEVVADGKYALIGAGADNSSWNETLADNLYLFLDGSNANTNIDIGSNMFSSFIVATEALGGQGASVALNFSEDYVIKPTQDNAMDIGESESWRFKNLYLGGNATADFYKGDGSLLTNLPSGDNSSWNETYADTLYADISVTGDNSSWNETYADTLYADISVVDTNETSRFNNLTATDCGAGELVIGVQDNGTVLCATDATGAGGTNKKGDGTYIYNDTTTMYFNSTLAGTDLAVNGSNYWDDYDTANSTWFENIAGALSLKLSELTSFVDTWLGTKDTDDLTEGSVNLYDNSSWNESHADTIYATIGSGGNSSFNQSLTDDLYINIAGDQTDSNEILINTTFSNTSAIPAINIASFTFRNVNDTGASSVSALNDEGFGSSIFSFGSNAILSNISGLARYGGDLSILVGTPGNNIEMKIVNATGGIEDTLIIQSDGNVLLKNRLLFEDTNKSIYSDVVNGGSGLFFLANETLSAGETPFIFVARNSTGSEIKPLILQNGKNNSGSYWRNSEIIGGDMGIANENNLTDCLFMLDLWGQHVHVGCDTDDTGSDVIVQDDIQLGGTIFAEVGILAESRADFIMNGNDMSIFNGSIHPATPVTFEQGFTEGDSVTIFTSEFSGNINPFENIQSDSSNWNAVADVLCNDGQCANSNGIGGTGNIIMQTNKSTSNVNETTLSFVYSIVGLVGGNDFVVTVNNNIGSGDVEILTDTGTESLISVNIALPASMDDASLLTISFDCGATSVVRDCFVDDVKLNGTASTTTQINISSFDSVINMGDGTLAADGYPVRGIFYYAENDTIVIRGDVTQTSISEIDLNVTTSITLQGETISFWSNITQFVTNMLLADGSRSLTSNWDQGAFNLTNTDSWFLGKIDWSTIVNKFSGSTTDDLTEGSSNLYDNSSWNESWADTLYADISVTGDNSTWNETWADTLYAPVNYGDDWNKTYADTLYADISVTGDNSSWNETYADTKYTTLATILGFSYYNATDFSISAYYTSSQIEGFSYWNDTYATFNETYADTLYADISVTGGFTTDQNDELNTTGGPTFENISAKAVYGNGDPDTYINWSADDQLELFAGGISFIHLIEGAGDGIAFNQDGNDIDWRVESVDHTHALAIDAGTGKVRMENYTNCNALGTDATGILSCSIDDWNKTYADTLYAPIAVPASTITAGTFGTGNYVMDTNLTVEKVVFENSADHYIEDNSTCLKIYGSTSILEIC